MTELDSKLQVSDAILTDLLLDNAGLSRGEKLIILTAAHDNPTFESAGEALLSQTARKNPCPRIAEWISTQQTLRPFWQGERQA